MFAIVAVATTSHAQVTWHTTTRELGDVLADAGYVVGSPLRADGRDWAAAGIVALTFGALLPLDAPVDRWIVRHPNAAAVAALKPFREQGGVLNRLVTARQLMPISGALLLGGLVGNDRHLREAGYGCLSAWASSNVVRYSVYALVARERPSSAEGQPFNFRVPGDRKWEHQAFFAGHTTNAFACASFWNTRFDLGAGEPVIYATAALTALSRLADRRHWTSDTFMGVTIGTVVGRVVASRYDRRAVVRKAQATAVSQPSPVVILWERAF